MEMNNWRKAIPLAKKVYEAHCAGCCLHIVLDDGNVNDSHVKFCIEDAIQNSHETCLELAKLLLSMSRTQRNMLYKHYSQYASW